MKTRKMAQVLTALALAATMTAPVTAFAEDSIIAVTPKNFSGEAVNSPQSGTTPINLNVTAGYIVTIPAKIDLVEGEQEVTDGTGENGDEIYTGKGTISVEDLHLGYGKSLQVDVDNATSFDLKDGDASIKYQVSTTKDGEALKAGDMIKTFKSEEGPSAGESQDVYFKTADPVTDAGDFSGNITFTFSVVGGE